MNTRTLSLCQSLRNVVTVIDAHPTLSAAASESRAFTLFMCAVADLDELHEEQASARIERRQLVARKRALTTDINAAIAVLHATAALLPATAPTPAPFAPLSTKLATCAFTVQATTIIDLTARQADVFIEHGLHPQTFDRARDLIAQLVAVDYRAGYTEATARSFNIRLAHALKHARKRRRQLYLELQRSMTDESHAAWIGAASLGRTHRPKLLKAGTGNVEGPQVRIGGIKRLARRVGLLARPETT
ncbi:MAG TPA: hypothetical protein VGM50_02155 [Gemmatimonadaceae bacterium]|jgi:hypothetical protein